MIPGIVAQSGVRTFPQTLTPALVPHDDTFYTPRLGIITWLDSATASNTSISGGKKVATNLSSGSTVHGVRSRLADYKTNPNGNYYFEVTVTHFAGGSKVGFGVADARASTVWSSFDIAGFQLPGCLCTVNDGHIYDANHIGASPANYTGKSIGALTDGDTIGVAFRANNWACFFKKVSGTPSGWDAATSSGQDDPTTVFGPTSITQVHVPILTFGGSAGATGNVFTVNFGDSPFVGIPPAGFIPFWSCNQVLEPTLITDTDTFYSPHL